MNRMIRHIKDGFIGVFRHFALAFSSISSMAVTLMLMSIFMILNQNINQVTHQIEQNISLYVQIDEGTTKEEIDELETKIQAISQVTTVNVSDKDTELELFIQLSGEEGEELFSIFRGEENPFLDVLIINLKSGTEIKTVADSISEFEHIFNVSYGGESTQSLLNAMESIRNIGFIFVVILGGVAIFLIANTIGATINSRNDEISIMRTVGATNWYIRWPFVIEGIIIGILGSLLPVALTIFGYQKLYTSQTLNLSSFFKLVDPSPMVWQLSIIILISGATIGAVGSLISVSRRLRWTR